MVRIGGHHAEVHCLERAAECQVGDLLAWGGHRRRAVSPSSDHELADIDVQLLAEELDRGDAPEDGEYLPDPKLRVFDLSAG